MMPHSGVVPPSRATRLAALSDEIAVVGIGETDYRADYHASRLGMRTTDAYGHAAAALREALQDSGLERDTIDGLVLPLSLSYERLAEVCGINPTWASQADAPNAIIHALLAISAGLAETVAIVYGTDQRSAKTAYGGPNAMGGELYLSYVYFASWGLTSQGALYGLMTRRYMELHDFTERDLAEVAVAQRAYAVMNERAVMQKPLTADDYLNAPYIAEPLRLYDYCIINDGGVAMILTTRDRAMRSSNRLVTIAGIGKADENTDATSLAPRLKTFYHDAHATAAKQVFDSAGVDVSDIDVLGIYDSFSCHVPFALEGFGFCPIGEAGKVVRGNGIGPGGRIPVNTSGGHLSESYMHGWNHHPELVRQLRGTCGGRQVSDPRHAQFISDVAGNAVSIIYRGH